MLVTYGKFNILNDEIIERILLKEKDDELLKGEQITILHGVRENYKAKL